MKLASFVKKGKECVGLFSANQLYDIEMMHSGLPGTMLELLASWDENYPKLLQLSLAIDRSPQDHHQGFDLASLELLAPVPHPPSYRDGYAFRQHVETARRNRGLEMTPIFDAFPVFYFGNHHSIQGPGLVHCMPDHFRKLDFELEAAIVISRKGKNIPVEKADDYIAGMMILNDLSARSLQMEEMLLNLGPAKGKDFASATGPWLVTLEELKTRQTAGWFPARLFPHPLLPGQSP